MPVEVDSESRRQLTTAGWGGRRELERKGGKERFH